LIFEFEYDCNAIFSNIQPKTWQSSAASDGKWLYVLLMWLGWLIFKSQLLNAGVWTIQPKTWRSAASEGRVANVIVLTQIQKSTFEYTNLQYCQKCGGQRHRGVLRVANVIALTLIQKLNFEYTYIQYSQRRVEQRHWVAGSSSNVIGFIYDS